MRVISAPGHTEDARCAMSRIQEKLLSRLCIQDAYLAVIASERETLCANAIWRPGERLHFCLHIDLPLFCTLLAGRNLPDSNVALCIGNGEELATGRPCQPRDRFPRKAWLWCRHHREHRRGRMQTSLAKSEESAKSGSGEKCDHQSRSKNDQPEISLLG